MVEQFTGVAYEQQTLELEDFCREQAVTYRTLTDYILPKLEQIGEFNGCEVADIVAFFKQDNRVGGASFSSGAEAYLDTIERFIAYDAALAPYPDYALGFPHLTLSQAAQVLNVNPSTVQKWVGKFKHIKERTPEGVLVDFPETAILEWQARTSAGFLNLINRVEGMRFLEAMKDTQGNAFYVPEGWQPLLLKPMAREWSCSSQTMTRILAAAEETDPMFASFIARVSGDNLGWIVASQGGLEYVRGLLSGFADSIKLDKNLIVTELDAEKQWLTREDIRTLTGLAYIDFLKLLRLGTELGVLTEASGIVQLKDEGGIYIEAEKGLETILFLKDRLDQIVVVVDKRDQLPWESKTTYELADYFGVDHETIARIIMEGAVKPFAYTVKGIIAYYLSPDGLVKLEEELQERGYLPGRLTSINEISKGLGIRAEWAGNYIKTLLADGAVFAECQRGSKTKAFIRNEHLLRGKSDLMAGRLWPILEDSEVRFGVSPLLVGTSIVGLIEGGGKLEELVIFDGRSRPVGFSSMGEKRIKKRLQKMVSELETEIAEQLNLNLPEVQSLLIHIPQGEVLSRAEFRNGNLKCGEELTLYLKEVKRGSKQPFVSGSSETGFLDWLEELKKEAGSDVEDLRKKRNRRVIEQTLQRLRA